MTLLIWAHSCFDDNVYVERHMSDAELMPL